MQTIHPCEAEFDRDQDDADLNNCSLVPEDAHCGTCIANPDANSQLDPLKVNTLLYNLIAGNNLWTFLWFSLSFAPLLNSG